MFYLEEVCTLGARSLVSVRLTASPHLCEWRYLCDKVVVKCREHSSAPLQKTHAV